jgi:glycosyltransferase involved in cell wall biosynthesis
MNITHFVENLNRGGLERAVIDLIRAQVDLGHRCQVVCLFERGSLADELSSCGVAVHACRKRRGLDLGALLRARRHVRDHATEVLHTHNAAAHYHAVLATIGLSLRCTVNTRHGMGVLDRRSRRERLFRLSLSRTDAVVTVCETARQDMLRVDSVPASRLISIPNGIRVERFLAGDADSRSRFALDLGLPASTPIIGTVGRLVEAKQHVSLISAVAELRRQTSDFAAVIVGDGVLRATLNEHVTNLGLGDRVFLLGDRSDVDTLLRGFSIFALSSATEGYSIALLEACAVGLPIVATDVGGNAEIVADGINGLVIPPHDPSALAKALRALLDDAANAEAMGRKGRAWVIEEGSFTTMAARYDALYSRVTSGGRAS